ncbi:MAG: superinfection exclusion B family protein [Ferrimonas sp.]
MLSAPSPTSLNQWHWLAKKVAISIAMWCLIAGLALMTLPIPTLQSLYLQQWVEEHGFLIGLMVIVSASYLAAAAVLWIIQQRLMQQQQLQWRQQIVDKMKFLDAQERAILREFFLQANPLVKMPLHQSTVMELLESGILEQVGEQQQYAIEGPVAQLRLSQVARQHLNRTVLRLPEGELNEQQRQQLIASRPDFITAVNTGRRN